jgi:solute carrier family 50 protein (sugar transporter)
MTAPIQDLRKALLNHSLGALNPFPWVMMSGNCLGWVVYGYYTHDPFVVAGNVPGLILSIWLNSGASKLQYYELAKQGTDHVRRLQNEEHWDAANNDDDVDGLSISSAISNMNSMSESLIMVPQERALLRILVAWASLVLWVGWLTDASGASTVIGIVVNINLIFFYGAPLQNIQTVISTGNSESMHVPTMVTSTLNTLFWAGYGVARRDAIILLPNGVGLLLSLLQFFLVVTYPRKTRANHEPLTQEEEDDEAHVAGGIRREQETSEIL